VAATSAAERAHETLPLTFEAATVSVTVTSKVAQRPSCDGLSVSPSGRFPSDLRRPSGSLMEGNPDFDNERYIRSFASDDAALDLDCVCTIERESH